MNTKKNNGNNMQPYIPKGNGEHSGEYTFNSYASDDLVESIKSDKNYDDSSNHLINHKKEFEHIIYILEKENVPNIANFISNFDLPAGKEGDRLLNIIDGINDLDDLYNFYQRYIFSLIERRNYNNYLFLKEVKNDIMNYEYNYYYGLKKIIGSHSLNYDVSVINPNPSNDIMRKLNCVNCVLSLYARRELGLDVMAKPFERDITISDVKRMFIDLDVSVFKGNKKNTIEKALYYVEFFRSNDSKYFFGYTTRNESHAIYIETNGGTISIFDPQSGREISIKELKELDVKECYLARMNGKQLTKEGKKCYMRRY